MINSEKMIIRCGYQSSVEFPIKNIESIQPAKEQGVIGEKTPKDTYFAMFNLDSPQYEIILKEPALMISSYGRKKEVITVIFRADKPSEMIEEINSKIKFLR